MIAVRLPMADPPACNANNFLGEATPVFLECWRPFDQWSADKFLTPTILRLVIPVPVVATAIRVRVPARNAAPSEFDDVRCRSTGGPRSSWPDPRDSNRHKRFQVGANVARVTSEAPPESVMPLRGFHSSSSVGPHARPTGFAHA